MSELVFGQLKGLPVNNNVVTVPSGHTLYAPGHIVQVQSVLKVNEFTTTATSYTDITGLSVSITPKFATSKILVMAIASLSQVTASDSLVQLVRDSTVIGSGTAGSLINGFGQAASTYQNNIFNQGINIIDTPNTTASVTYKIQGRVYSGGTLCINRRGVDGAWGTTSSIVVMELAA